ncbi:MAG: acyl-CoA thioester hydrolase/BAAT C-terminal domain-containing protein [Gemmatimonadota bacterium]
MTSGPTAAAILALALSAVLTPAPAAAQTTGEARLSDDWAGWIYLDQGGDLPVRARLGNDSALLDLPHLSRFGLPARVVEEGPGLRLDVDLDGTPILLVAPSREGVTIKGRVRIGDSTEGDFWLHRSALELDRGDPEPRTACTGSYRFPDGRKVTVFARGWNELRYFDGATGRQGTLFATSDSTFFTGEAEYVPTVVTGSVLCRRNGTGGVLGWSEPEGDWSWGEPAGFRERELRFESEGAELVGTVLLPPGEGPFPAAVTLGGSNWTTRASIRGESESLASNGVAVLIFDKRGHGESGGDQTVPFATIAADARSGAEALRSLPEIRDDAVGVFGRSRGGWPAPLATAGSSAFAFVVLFVPSGRTPAEQETYRRLAVLEDAGATPAALRKAKRYLDLMYSWLRTGEGWEAYEAALWELSDAEFSVLGGSDTPDPSSWEWNQLNAHFDPFPYWEHVRIPVLAIFGEDDRSVETSVSLPRISAALARGGNSEVTLLAIPGVGHSLRTGLGPQLHLSTGYAQEVWPTVREWLAQIH